MRQNQIVFAIGGVVLSSRLIEGQFPNYRQLLPETYEHELTLAGGEVTDVVRRISLLAQKNAPLRLSFQPGELIVSAQTPDIGEARESLPVAFQGEPFEIGFNPEFLRDGLESVEAGDIVLKLISPLRPGLIQAARRRRLPLPDHADPAERLGGAPIGSCASRCATSAATPRPTSSWPGRDGRHRAQRRRQDEPARGAVHRLHRTIVSNVERARDGALRRRARASR